MARKRAVIARHARVLVMRHPNAAMRFVVKIENETIAARLLVQFPGSPHLLESIDGSSPLIQIYPHSSL